MLLVDAVQPHVNFSFLSKFYLFHFNSWLHLRQKRSNNDPQNNNHLPTNPSEQSLDRSVAQDLTCEEVEKVLEKVLETTVIEQSQNTEIVHQQDLLQEPIPVPKVDKDKDKDVFLRNDASIRRRRSVRFDTTICKYVIYNDQDAPQQLVTKSRPRLVKDNQHGLFEYALISSVNDEPGSYINPLNARHGDVRVNGVSVVGGIDGKGKLDIITSDSSEDQDSVEQANAQLSVKILVTNRTYNKRVMVRYTQDQWKTHQNVPAQWVHSVTKEFDLFECLIPIEFIKSKCNIEFATCCSFKYPGNTVESWDSNNGKNWRISCLKTSLRVPMAVQERHSLQYTSWEGCLSPVA